MWQDDYDDKDGCHEYDDDKSDENDKVNEYHAYGDAVKKDVDDCDYGDDGSGDDDHGDSE